MAATKHKHGLYKSKQMIHTIENLGYFLFFDVDKLQIHLFVKYLFYSYNERSYDF